MTTNVENNDDLSPEKGVRAASVDSNDVKVSTMPLKMLSEIKWHYMDGGECVQELTKDSREKLLYDASELVADCAPSGKECDPMYRAIVELLDRQAAITKREWCSEQGWWDSAEECNRATAKAHDLQAKVDGLTAERDMWRDRCGRMLDAAHELARIAEVDG